nr:RNA polymerase recycling motor HelD [Paenibacillus turpanensis]
MDSDWLKEQERAVKVLEIIHGKIEELQRARGEMKGEVVQSRRQFWDDIRLNVGDGESTAEAYASVKQQAEMLNLREQQYASNTTQLAKLKKLTDSLYFGRVDFKETGEQTAEPIYIGICSLQEDELSPFLIYDWRAPISSLYYDHEPGTARYESPMGPVAGEITMKRQFVIRDGTLKLMFDTNVTIGDQLLQEVLSRSSDVHMKSIVATIQREQNEMIRHDRCRMLIVNGTAGSGKTSAALQRVAYLLYKHRNTLTADQMVLFSPNPMFNSYVSSVLPELGEQNMQQTTFQEYVEHRLFPEFTVEDPFTQLEFVLAANDPELAAIRTIGIQYKSSKAFLNVIFRYRDFLRQRGMRFHPIRFRGVDLVSADVMMDKFYSFDPAFRLQNRIELIRDWLLQQISLFEETELQADWIEDEAELLTQEQYRRAYEQLVRQKAGRGTTFDDYDQEKTILARMVLAKHLEPIRRGIKQLSFVDSISLYRQLFEPDFAEQLQTSDQPLPKEWPDICRQTVELLDRKELCFEDTAPFLFLRELCRGFETNPSIRYVFIDEVQDYTPFQLQLIRNMFPRAKMTVLGDLNQTIFAHTSSLQEADTLWDLYGQEQTELLQFTKSYRSTFEIIEFTRGMVPNGAEIVPFQRNGRKPVVALFYNKEKLLNEIWRSVSIWEAQGFDSIAVLCKTAKESEDMYNALLASSGEGKQSGYGTEWKGKLSLVTKDTPKYEKGVVVMPIYLAKGVEFDAVLVFDACDDKYSSDHDRRLLYTACTRAMHELQIGVVGEPSRFISRQSDQLYTLSSNGFG